MDGSADPIGPGKSESACLLRPWTEADGPGLREAIDEDVDHLRPWLSWTLEEPATLEQTRSRLAGWVDQFTRGTAFRYAIVPLDRPVVILGGAGLTCRFGPGAHDVSYWVRRSAARQGIATAAVCRLVVASFARPDLERLIIQCDVGNSASAAVARALGFRFNGPATTKYADGAPRPVYRFELNRDLYLLHATTLQHHARRMSIAAGADAVPCPGAERELTE